MLGVYSNMVPALSLTGQAALGVNFLAVSRVPAASRIGETVYLTDFGAVIYQSPSHWLIMLAPLAFVMIASMRADRMATSSARAMLLFT